MTSIFKKDKGGGIYPATVLVLYHFVHVRPGNIASIYIPHPCKKDKIYTMHFRFYGK